MKQNNEMADYIFSILSINIIILWSWQFRKPTIIENGLKFRVSGFIFKGWVYIIYNEGLDLFDIKLITNKNLEVKAIDGICFDELVKVIDDNIEHIENYKEAVIKRYSKQTKK